jgi:hypothetical protein
MKLRFAAFLAVVIFTLGGCAGTPQSTVSLEQGTPTLKGSRVGLYMAQLPKVDSYFPGAGCLLCIATASLANAKLTAYTQTLPHDELAKLKSNLANLLRARGATVVDMPDTFSPDSLPRSQDKGANIALIDFSSLRTAHKIDKLAVIDISRLGILRPYSAYFPTSDPKASLVGVGYLVNLINNQYEWYQPVQVSKSAEGAWDEPPKFPGLTNAYFQTLEIGKDTFLKPFEN